MAGKEPKTAQPLEGLQVLDMTRLLPGPLATMILADYGADVIKVEDVRAGDLTRYVGSSLGGGLGAEGSLFRQLNRNKKSVALDLKEERGQEIIKQLATGADVMVEGFRPGVMDRLGLGYGEMSRHNRGLVYAAITGYGQDSLYRHKAGHDLNYMALSGLLELSAEKEGSPVMPTSQISDVAGGALMAVNGIMMALYERERSGRGRFVDVSMTRGLLPWLTYPASYLGRGEDLPRRGRCTLSGAYACYNIYETADGKYMSLAALEPVFWQRFCEAVGKPQWIERQFEQEVDEPVGSRNLIQAVRALFKTKKRAYWEELFKDVDACCEPVLDLQEAIDHPLSREENYWLENTLKDGTREKAAGFPLLFSGRGGEKRLPPPEHGRHTEEILKALGYSAGDIEELKQQRIIKNDQ